MFAPSHTRTLTLPCTAPTLRRTTCRLAWLPFQYTPATPVTASGGVLGYGSTVGMSASAQCHHGGAGAGAGAGAPSPLMQQLAQARLERSERYREQQARRTFTPGRHRKRPVTDRPCNDGGNGESDGIGDEDCVMAFTPPEKRRHIAAPASSNEGTDPNAPSPGQGWGGQQNQMATWPP